MGGNRSLFFLHEVLLERGPHIIYIAEARHNEFPKLIYVSSNAEKILGWKPEEISENWWFDNIHPQDVKKVKAIPQKLSERSEVFYCQRLRRKRGDYLWIKGYGTLMESSADFRRIAGYWTDSTKEKKLEHKLRKGKEFYELILSNLSDLVAVIDSGGFLKYVSPAFERILGLKPEELKEVNFLNRVHPEERHRLKRMISIVFRNPGKEFSRELRMNDQKGQTHWMEARIFLPESWKKAGLKGAILSLRDITEKVILEQRVVRATYYDSLTGLPNRRLFYEKLEENLKILRRRKEIVAVSIINIARFREVNATYGMKVGDHVLKEVGKRLEHSLRSSDLVGRLVADEFCVALFGIKTLTGVNIAVEKIKNTFKEPVHSLGYQIYLEVNIGVSIFPRDGEGADELIRKAEIALTKAQEAGPGSISYFSEETEEEITRIATIRNALMEALEKREIVPYYQPVFALQDGKLIGVEALARWESPDLGTLDPARFISVAEDTGTIIDIGYCILNQAVRDISTINREGIKLSLGVNFSARQFNDESLPEKVREMLETYRFPPDLFIMEITESTAMREPERTREILLRMREMGVKLAIDDFGTGYSSMNYLLDFEVDKIKIDKSFVTNMQNNEKAERLVITIINLTRSLGARSLAEGVENREIFEKLVKLGCDEGQGFYFAKPMSFDKLREYVSERV